jgi:hypothetical protein
MFVEGHKSLLESDKKNKTHMAPSPRESVAPVHTPLFTPTIYVQFWGLLESLKAIIHSLQVLDPRLRSPLDVCCILNTTVSPILSAKSANGWTFNTHELNWSRYMVLSLGVLFCFLHFLLSNSKTEMYTSTSQITINFEIIAQHPTTHKLYDIIPDSNVPSAKWFVSKSTWNGRDAPQGSQ